VCKSDFDVRMLVQGGEDALDAISCSFRFLSAKELLIIGLFCRKSSLKIRHPTGLATLQNMDICINGFSEPTDQDIWNLCVSYTQLAK